VFDEAVALVVLFEKEHGFLPVGSLWAHGRPPFVISPHDTQTVRKNKPKVRASPSSSCTMDPSVSKKIASRDA
jgi:hypothetical protein